MVKLSVQDSSVLTRLAQYHQLSTEDKHRILGETSSDEARQIGRILLGEDVQASSDVAETARVFQSWAQANRRDMMGRMKACGQKDSFDLDEK